MASLLIRNVDDALHNLLKTRAKANHRSMAEEARESLRVAIAKDACTPPQKETLYDIAQRIFGPIGGVELNLPPRSEDLERPPMDFSGPEFDP